MKEENKNSIKYKENGKEFTVSMAQHIEHDIYKENLPFKEALADKITSIMGSYSFLIGNLIIIFGYIILQKIYPFDTQLLYLNFLLSFQAAIGMPILQMSSNRQSSVDRTHMNLDMEINVQSKDLIKLMHERIDEQNSVLDQQSKQIEQLIAMVKDLKNNK